MAVLEAKVMASLLFKRFRLELVPGHRVTYEATLQLPMKNGLRVTLVPRSGAR
jgi:cytochrome P450